MVFFLLSGRVPLFRYFCCSIRSIGTDHEQLAFKGVECWILREPQGGIGHLYRAANVPAVVVEEGIVQGPAGRLAVDAFGKLLPGEAMTKA